MAIELKIRNDFLVVNKTNDPDSGPERFIFLLEDKVSGATLPMVFDPFRGGLIALMVNGGENNRSIFSMAQRWKRLELSVIKIEIYGLENFQYCFRVHVEEKGEVEILEMYPIDALLLSINWKIGIQISETVFMQAIEDEEVKDLIEVFERKKGERDEKELGNDKKDGDLDTA